MAKIQLKTIKVITSIGQYRVEEHLKYGVFRVIDMEDVSNKWNCSTVESAIKWAERLTNHRRGR